MLTCFRFWLQQYGDEIEREGWPRKAEMCDREKRTRKIYKPLFRQRGSNKRDRVEQAAAPLGLDRKKKDDGRH